ncbi:metallophosphoesterase [Desulfurobacterium indicum]|uniref:Metallophosphoesterase n=1 Tax=Desulfurobacterium indicum TaxID=1914305 RepID=A0A1R1MJT1_9BACT|nr:metallophosphoesterase [Desulfurobacterium indicum]OMH40019.1 metallophosphoesterase [Desulfurobacterium indicum]
MFLKKKRGLFFMFTALSAASFIASCGGITESSSNSTANATSRFGDVFFIHFADVHLTNDTEVGDVFGGTIPPVKTMNEAISQVISLEPDLLVDTGDIVALADSHDLDTDERWYRLVNATILSPIQSATIPFLFAPGNHDPAGIKYYNATSPETKDPRYDNGLIFEYIDKGMTKTYYSYTKGKYHFIMLDPEEIPETGYRTVKLPDDELDWLKQDLAAHSDDFMVIAYHQPLGSWDNDSYSAFMEAVKPYKSHMLIIAGHTHDNRLIYRDGIPEYQDGALCGDWWQTGKTPDGNPMGYAVYYIKDGKVERFYKGIETTKQINLLSPVDVVMSEPKSLDLNVYYANKTISSVIYKVDNGTAHSLSFEEVSAPGISWYHVNGTLEPTEIDDKNHNVLVSVKTSDGDYYNRTIVYKFSKNPFMTISEITNDTNFNNYYGRFVKVNATITNVAYDGNLLTLKDSTGEIVVWAGDCHHPDFSVGDEIVMRGQVTAFRGTKELKLVSADDVNIWGHADVDSEVIKLDNIEEAYEDFSQLENKYVQVSGIVTGVFGNLITIQDTTRGIALWLGEIEHPTVSLGDNVTAAGELTTYNNMTEIVVGKSDDFNISGSSDVPSPIPVVYDILCKLEKWDNLLGNTPQIPTPGGKNGTTEDFTRPS